jgi:hypothetical protein
LNIKDSFHQLRINKNQVNIQEIGGVPPLNEITDEISSIVQEFTFCSVRTIADSLSIHISKVFSR